MEKLTWVDRALDWFNSMADDKTSAITAQLAEQSVPTLEGPGFSLIIGKVKIIFHFL